MFLHPETFYHHMFYLHWIILCAVWLNILLVLFDQVYSILYRNDSSIILFIVDFISAMSNMPPMTPNNETGTNSPYPRTPSTSSTEGATSDEVSRLYHQYRKLAERNRE